MFKLSDFVTKAQEVSGRLKVKPSSDVLHSTGQIVAAYGYEEALAFVSGKYKADKGADYRENAETLMVLDLIKYLQNKDCQPALAGYLIKKVLSILAVKEVQENV